MVSASNITDEIKGAIDSNSMELIKRLNELGTLKFNPDIDLIDFELFIEPTRFELDIMIYSMSETGDEVVNDKEKELQGFFAGSKSILTEAKFYGSMNDIPIDNEFLKHSNQIEQAIIDWFVQCWEKSSCNNFVLPMHVGVHDTQQSFFLQEKRWVSFVEKYPNY